MYYGCDYYPEHWPEERLETDAKLMREAGINVVRLAEFAWVKMEPAEGEFEFGWLDRAIDVLAASGISVVLGTPTASPPAWLIEKNPEIPPVTLNGTVWGFGARQHTCHSQPAFREHTRTIVAAMAEHYKDNPHVIGWQTDNELATILGDTCFCNSCRDSFHDWLRRKYGTIDALNEAWGTVFWSQTYGKWEHVPLPKPVPGPHSPSLLLDWRRFQSDLEADYQQLHIDIIRSAAPHHWITHNLMGLHSKMNYFDLSRNLDFVSWDNYPMGFWTEQGNAAHSTALAHDLMRGMKNKPFWVMEQQSGPAGWETLGNTPRPGQLRLWTYQSVAHGADGIVYFRWRSCLFGGEEYWHGILPHSGIPGRRYEEIARTSGELRPVVDRIEGGSSAAEIGILYSYDQLWAFNIQPHHPELKYLQQVERYYEALHRANIPTDIVELALDGDWSKYKVLIAPLLFLMTPELSEKLKDYAAQGGRLILTMRSGVKDWNNVVNPLVLPGLLSELAGITIDDYDCLRGNEQYVRWADEPAAGAASGDTAGERKFAAAKWCDVVEVTTAEAQAVFTEDYYAGQPAVTVNRCGLGEVWYVATEPEVRFISELLGRIAGQAGITPVMATPDGVEAVRRVAADGAIYVFILNHGKESKQVTVPHSWRHATGEAPAEGTLLLPAYGVSVLVTE